MQLVSSNGNTISLQGKLVDSQTRCEHYHTDVDVIALKFKCCHVYYPCFECHQAAAHLPEKFHIEQDAQELVVLCGVCVGEMTFGEYSLRDPLRCVYCDHLFNVGCKLHYDLYFETS